MIYDSAGEKERESIKEQESLIRLAKVTGLDDGKRAVITFCGERTASGKTYSYLDGYIPKENDIVAVARQGDTYIILGKISKEEVKEVYAVKEHTHNQIKDKTYGVSIDGDCLKPDSSEMTIGKIGNRFKITYTDLLNATKILINGNEVDPVELFRQTEFYDANYVSSNSRDSNKIVYKNKKILPTTSEDVSLGSESKIFNEGHFKNIVLDGTEIDLDALTHQKTWYDGYYLGTNRQSHNLEYNNKVITPATTEEVSLGTETKKFNEGHFKKVILGGIEMDPMIWYDAYYASGYYKSNHNMSYNNKVITPATSGEVSIGTSTKKMNAGYFTNLYLNGTAVTTSDKRKKKKIRHIEDKFKDFFRKLRPVTFEYKEGTSGRRHTGFIAQEVEQAMKSSGITNEEFGGLVIQKSGEYGLRYEEFIALQTKLIQELMEKVERIEANNGK